MGNQIYPRQEEKIISRAAILPPPGRRQRRENYLAVSLPATRETTQKTFPPTRAHRSNFSDSLYPTMEDELCFWWMEMIEWCYWNSFFDRSFQTNFKNTLSKQKYVWERAFGSIRLKPGNYFFRKYFLKEPNYWNFPLMPPFNLQEKSPNIIKVEYRSWKICLINSF